MFFDKAYFDDKNNPIEVDIICNKCGKIMVINDMNKFQIIKNDYCIIKDDNQIICDGCENIGSGMLQYKNNIKIKDAFINKSQSPLNQPKCPTCGSTNIQKISVISKTVGAVAFGLFSKTAKSQFKCLNCDYKW